MIRAVERLRVGIVRFLCSLLSHQAQGRTAVLRGERTVLVCNGCGKEGVR